MVELIDKWQVVSKLITLQNNYTFFKNVWDAERLYREIAKLEIEICKTPGLQLVRCKDCKHWKHFEHLGCTDFVKVCGLANYMIGENGYCLYGERKEE